MAQIDPPKSPPPRVVGRLCIDFILRAVRSVSRHLDGDILGGLVVLALLQRELSQTTAIACEAAEQIAARPISVKSLARSLKSPPETMRRCVVRLIAKGWCGRIDRQGIVLLQSASAREKIAALMADIRNEFSLMLADLRSIDFDFDLMDRAATPDDGRSTETRAPAAANIPSSPPAGFDRVMLNFGLRVVDSGTTPFGNDYVLTCVFSAIMSANASPFAYDPQDAWKYGTYTTPPPDNARRPASLTEISQILGIPYETARRYVNALIARGHCTRDARKGLLIPMDLLQSQPSLVTGMEIVGRFVQMIGELKHLGFDFRALPSTRGG